MHPMLTIAIRAARRAGNVLIKAYENPSSIELEAHKGHEPVTNIDRSAETIIIDTIRKAYPDHTIISAEAGLIKGSDAETQWIVDPIDGTANFIRGIPHFAVTIALRIKGRTEVAVVFNPLTNELFTTTRGAGAQLNERRIRVNTKTRNLSDSFAALQYPLHRKNDQFHYSNVINLLIEKSVTFRESGCTALDLCYIAAGRYDLYFAIGLKSWHIAAGELILRESGGILSDLSGNTNYFALGHVVAGTPKITKEFLQISQSLWSESLLR